MQYAGSHVSKARLRYVGTHSTHRVPPCSLKVLELRPQPLPSGTQQQPQVGIHLAQHTTWHFHGCQHANVLHAHSSSGLCSFLPEKRARTVTGASLTRYHSLVAVSSGSLHCSAPSPPKQRLAAPARQPPETSPRMVGRPAGTWQLPAQLGTKPRTME